MSKLMVKVCGMREPDNILALSALPVDMVGFIFYEKSPRAVKGDALETWLSQHPRPIPATLRRVGVFVNAPIEEVLNRTHDFELDVVQLHGEESPEYCRELISFWTLMSMHKPMLMKAFSVDAQFDFAQVEAYSDTCAYALFDTKTTDYGGSGRAFDWQVLQQYAGSLPFFLSGGIDPTMVEALREIQHPKLAGIDLNSRFESAPGLKQIELIQEFLNKLVVNSQ